VKTMSGRTTMSPPVSFKCTRKRRPRAWSSDLSSTSGFVSRLRFARIVAVAWALDGGERRIRVCCPLSDVESGIRDKGTPARRSSACRDARPPPCWWGPRNVRI
jgi:hypothetical protein